MASENPPSAVLHLRNVPQDASIGELRNLLSPFGTIVESLIMRAKGQALVEMNDVSAATRAVSFFNDAGEQASIKNRNVYMDYSKHIKLTPTRPEVQTGSQGIIMANISNAVFPITVDVIAQVFGKYGQLAKVIIFPSKRNPADISALIQFAERHCSGQAMAALDGKNIYNACCTLQLQYSNLDDLTVRQNSDKSRDFFNNNLPTGNQSGSSGVISTPQQMPSFHGGMGMGGNQFLPQQSRQQQVVMMVGNLDPERVTPDILFVLFGVFGDVQRVKIMFNKRDNALVQVATEQQCRTCINNLNQCTLFSKPMTVRASHFSSITPAPTTDQDDGPNLNRDYTDSPLHRFKKPDSKNYQNIFPPNTNLHISNIPEGTTEETLRQKFGEFGNVVNFRFFNNSNKMAIVEMASLDEAVTTLVATHNLPLTEENHLRVSFAKKQ